MWLIGAFTSALLLGIYDVFKKKALINNDVIPVLFFNTVISSLIFTPLIILSQTTSCLNDSLFYIPSVGWEQHKYIVIKSFIVLSSWIFGYFSMKHLPLTIVGPINATRPIIVLVGAMLVYGETLNIYQWIGVLLAVCSFFLLSRTGKKEGIDFKHDKWIYFLVLAALLGAISGLYDKYLMASSQNGGVGLNKMVVQSWFNIYQMLWMALVFIFVWLPRNDQSKTNSVTLTSCEKNKPINQKGFIYRLKNIYYIVGISVFLCLADFVYFYSLSIDGAMISIVSMVRRGSVIVSFAFGAFILDEKNLKGKAFDLLFVIFWHFVYFLFW